MSSDARRTRTGDDILDAAWTLIAERGAAVSLSEIARAASVSRQSIHLHFGSRGGLLDALVRRADQRFGIAAAFEAAICRPEPRQRLDRALQAWLDFIPKIHPVAIDLIRLRATDPDAAHAWSQRMTDLHGVFARLIASLAADGALAPEWNETEATDYLWAGVSVQAWDLLVTDRAWSRDRAGAVLRRTMGAALLGADEAGGGGNA